MNIRFRNAVSASCSHTYGFWQTLHLSSIYLLERQVNNGIGARCSLDVVPRMMGCLKQHRPSRLGMTLKTSEYIRLLRVVQGGDCMMES